MDKNNLVSQESINDLMLLKWEDGFESYIKLKILREKCPCANCKGEKDVFGNVYKDEPKPMNETSFLLKGIHCEYKYNQPLYCLLIFHPFFLRVFSLRL